MLTDPTVLAFAPIDRPAGLAYQAVTALAELAAPLAGASATAVAIIVFTMLVRLLIAPLSWAQAAGQRRQAALAPTLAPKLAELRRRYAADPARLSTETLALYRGHGASSLGGCLPGLLQAPFVVVLFRLFTSPEIDGRHNDLLDDTLFGVELGQRVTDGLTGGAGVVFLALFAVLAVLAWLMSRRMRANAATSAPAGGGAGAGGATGGPADAGPGAEVAAAMGRILPLLPYLTVVGAAFVPLAAGLYLLTATAWVVVEQRILHRRPAPRPAG